MHSSPFAYFGAASAALREELAELAAEIDAQLKDRKYHAMPGQLAGIDGGLKAAREGRFAKDEEAEAVFAKYRRA